MPEVHSSSKCQSSVFLTKKFASMYAKVTFFCKKFLRSKVNYFVAPITNQVLILGILYAQSKDKAQLDVAK
jgi:hypothetical protein